MDSDKHRYGKKKAGGAKASLQKLTKLLEDLQEHMPETHPFRANAPPSFHLLPSVKVLPFLGLSVSYPRPSVCLCG